MLRTSDAQEAAAALLSGRARATILAAMHPQQPDALLSALVVTARDRNVELTLLVADLSGAFGFLDETAHADVRDGRLRLVALAGAIPRPLGAYVDSYPLSLWEIDRALANRAIAYDVFVAQVEGEPGSDEAGLGCMVGWTPGVLASAPAVGVELAPPAGAVPRTDPVALDRVDVVLSVPANRVEPTPRPPDDAAVRIAELVGSLIPDGATVQLGLGAVPDALAGRLASKRGLRIHSGILPRSLRPLIAASVADGSPRHVATGVLIRGDWGDNVRLEPLAVTHAPNVLADLPCLWAVNSAFEIDLAGLVNAEYAGGARVASAGGQIDFFRAAHAGSGASVLALPSRARNGRPRILGHLPQDHIPTSTSADVDYVVTEQGIAELAGATAHERAERLIAVAHPDDREELEAFLSST